MVPHSIDAVPCRKPCPPVDRAHLLSFLLCGEGERSRKLKLYKKQFLLLLMEHLAMGRMDQVSRAALHL